MSATVVVTTPQANRHILEITAWFRENRSADLFTRELGDALALLKEAPRMGPPYPLPQIPELRRKLLRTTQYHVYYVYRPEQAALLVLAVWSARRGGMPRFARP